MQYMYIYFIFFDYINLFWTGLPNSKLICKMAKEKAQINIVVVPEEATTINELKKPVVEKEAPGHAI
ncbi:hypothetical protein glysoja_011576 [Glycine soja]|nr:hypothetical protein glysoja_011576 [Glycine soja]